MARGSGRPPIGPPITVRLPPDDHKAVEEQARAENLVDKTGEPIRAAMIRVLVAEALAARALRSPDSRNDVKQIAANRPGRGARTNLRRKPMADHHEWDSVVDHNQNTVEGTIAAPLGDHVGDYDLDAFAAAYREAIDDALPPTVRLMGNMFVGVLGGPWDGYPTCEDGTLDVKAIVDGIDYWAMAARFDRAAERAE